VATNNSIDATGDMKKARGPERRKWDSLKSWGIEQPKGFIERRRSVERRRPEVAESSFEEFERLRQSFKDANKGITEPAIPVAGRLFGTT
jgi:hypothetical protein